LKVNNLVKFLFWEKAPRNISAKLISRWRGLCVAEQLEPKVYIVEMPYNKVIHPMVQNI
jgi:hypothetical protein